MEEKSKKIFSKKEAYKKVGDYCAFQERCQQEVRNKLYLWGLHKEDVEAMIADLISDGFINEERFSKAFAGGKFRIKKWGRVKIADELKHRNISDYCIKSAMDEIDNREYLKTLNEIIRKKAKEKTGNNKFSKYAKVAAYAISRGYESDVVWDIIRYMTEEQEKS